MNNRDEDCCWMQLSSVDDDAARHLPVKRQKLAAVQDVDSMPSSNHHQFFKLEEALKVKNIRLEAIDQHAFNGNHDNNSKDATSTFVAKGF